MRKDSFETIWKKLKSCKSIVMSLHAGPDGDSLGSCVSMKYVLERDTNCKVDLISYDLLDSVLMDMPYAKEVRFGVDVSELDLKLYDALLVMDSSLVSGKLRESYRPPKDTFIIIIDHHESTKYNVQLAYIDPSAPSNCSVLIDMFKDVGVKFDKELSNRLMLGLCTDTGFLKYGGNKAIEDAEFLKKHGGDYEHFVSKIKDVVPKNIQDYYFFLKNSVKRKSIRGINVLYSVTNKSIVSKLKLNVAEVRLGPNYLSDMEDYDMLFTLADVDGYIKGSFRSKIDIDVSKFAEKLSGAGHKHSAGFRIEGTSIDEAEKIVLKVLEENL